MKKNKDKDKDNNTDTTTTPPDNGINHTKRSKLRTQKIFVLDNSLRESTVGQSAGHTLANKSQILQQIKKVGFQDVIVAAFGGGMDDRRVDDAFCEKLDDYFEESVETYAFTEIWDTDEDGDVMYDKELVPAATQKIRNYGIRNAIVEIDLVGSYIDWEGKDGRSPRVTVERALEALRFLLNWMGQNLKKVEGGCGKRRHMVNLRDLPLAMISKPKRVIEFVAGIAQLPPTIRPIAIIFEEPLGEYFPEEISHWTSTLRDTMDTHGWINQFQTSNIPDGMILYHVHEQYGLSNSTVLDVLTKGADGMWCSLSEEGAPLGHACSAVALTNLARLGNDDVLKRYDCSKLVEAARAVSEITTGQSVPYKQVVYGLGALDVCFGFGAIAQGKREDGVDYDGDGKVTDLDKFSVAGMIGVQDPPVRISTLASAELVSRKLRQCFGEREEFNEDAGMIMLREIKRRLENNIKEDYNRPEILAKLWMETIMSFPTTPAK